MLRVEKVNNYWCVFYGSQFLNSYDTEGQANEAMLCFQAEEANRLRKLVR